MKRKQVIYLMDKYPEAKADIEKFYLKYAQN